MSCIRALQKLERLTTHCSCHCISVHIWSASLQKEIYQLNAPTPDQIQKMDRLLFPKNGSSASIFWIAPGFWAVHECMFTTVSWPNGWILEPLGFDLSQHEAYLASCIAAKISNHLRLLQTYRPAASLSQQCQCNRICTTVPCSRPARPQLELIIALYESKWSFGLIFFTRSGFYNCDLLCRKK